MATSLVASMAPPTLPTAPETLILTSRSACTLPLPLSNALPPTMTSRPASTVPRLMTFPLSSTLTSALSRLVLVTLAPLSAMLPPVLISPALLIWPVVLMRKSPAISMRPALLKSPKLVSDNPLDCGIHAPELLIAAASTESTLPASMAPALAADRSNAPAARRVRSWPAAMRPPALLSVSLKLNSRSPLAANKPPALSLSVVLVISKRLPAST